MVFNGKSVKRTGLKGVVFGRLLVASLLGWSGLAFACAGYWGSATFSFLHSKTLREWKDSPQFVSQREFYFEFVRNPELVQFTQPNYILNMQDVKESCQKWMATVWTADGGLQMPSYHDWESQMREWHRLGSGFAKGRPNRVQNGANQDDDEFFSTVTESQVGRFRDEIESRDHYANIPSSFLMHLNEWSYAHRGVLKQRLQQFSYPSVKDLPKIRHETFKLFQKYLTTKAVGDLADYYQEAITALFFVRVNNSILMTQVNQLLESQGFKPVPHGYLDLVAMLLDRSSFQKYFEEYVSYYQTK